MKVKTLCVVLLSILVTSCNIRHAKNIMDCEFSLNSVSNVSVRYIWNKGVSNINEKKIIKLAHHVLM